MSCDRILLGGMTAAALMVSAAAFGHAQGNDKPPVQAAAEAPTSAEGETLKERLSDKASDEQRVDNCKVPLDRRGEKPRPGRCSHDDASATPAQPAQ